MPILNLGILAHVDAGKTTLTERILFETGVIAAAGSVDKGTTQTDTLELERARGITIEAAVVSFQLRELKVNLIDTPGHADFIAEVARSLLVLDAVVLVISAVEGVQPQTRRLLRAIRDARLPLLIFVNKIDRLGARGAALSGEIAQKLGLRALPMNAIHGPGDRMATVVALGHADPDWRASLLDLLAESSERTIEEFDRTAGAVEPAFLETEINAQVATGDVVPLFFGSAITGAGVSELLAGVERWLPRASTAADGAIAATIFKIARQASGEKLAYARLFAGELAVRQPVMLRRQDALGAAVEVGARITAIERFAGGTTTPARTLGAGEIGVLHGLRAARIGDRLGGDDDLVPAALAFAPPAFESVVRPADPRQVTRLRAALEELAEQDPLISLRQRNDEGEIAVRLYGEVQKDVMLATLARDYGVGACFGPSQTVHIERPVATGEHAEAMRAGGNPFYATLGFRIAPGASGSGLRYHRELGALPLAFYRATEETVRETLTQGLFGWEVTDCVVTVTVVGMCPASTAADFRNLAPLVVMEALRQAGVDVCEPVEVLELDIPEDAYGTVCGALLDARGVIRDTQASGATRHVACELPAAELPSVEQQLPRLTRGDGGWESRFAGYARAPGPPPARARAGPNPLNRAHYLADIARR